MWEDIEGEEECRGSFFLKYMEWKVEATIGRCGSQLTGWTVWQPETNGTMSDKVYLSPSHFKGENGKEIGEMFADKFYSSLHHSHQT